MDEIRYLLEFDTEELLNQNNERSQLIENCNQLPPRPYPLPNRETMIQTFQNLLQPSDQEGTKIRFFTIPSLLPFSKVVDISLLQPINLSQMQVPFVHSGTFILLRTITPSTIIVSVSAIAEDVLGNVCKISIFHFQKDMFADPNEIIPEGTVILIKEPYIAFGSTENDYALFVFSPSDIVFKDPVVDSEFLSANGANNWLIESNIEAFKQSGEENFNLRKYHQAVIFFNRVLSSNPTDREILIMKGNALLQLKRYYESYMTLNEAYGLPGDNLEYILVLMGSAAYGLREWDSAVKLFADAIAILPEYQDAKDGLIISQARLQESQTGNYDILDLFDNATFNCEPHFDLADFRHSAISFKVYSDKGRGYYVTETLPRGTLLLAAKAFAYTFDLDNFTLICSNMGNRQLHDRRSYMNYLEVFQILQRNPHLTKEFYSLYYFSEYSPDSLPPGIMDPELIYEICQRDSFSVDFSSSHELNSEKGLDSQHLPVGLWVSCSLFNHSCVPNTTRIIYDDFMLFYANVDIQAGEELTAPYISPSEPLDRRAYVFDCIFRFECQCPLCLEQRADPNYQRRIEMDQSQAICTMIEEGRLEEACTEGEALLTAMTETYTDQEYRMDLAYLLHIVGCAYMHQEIFDKAIKMFQDSLNNLGVMIVNYIVSNHLNLAKCYFHLQDLEKMNEAFNQAKEAAQAWCGIPPELFKHTHMAALTSRGLETVLE